MSTAENRQTLNNWLADIGSSTGQLLKLNDNGLCAFQYETQVFVVDVPENSPLFYCYTSLMILPFNDQMPFLKKLLTLNHLQQDTKGGILSLDPVTEEVIFSYSDRIEELDSNMFRNILENFIDKAVTLQKELSEFSASQPGNSAMPRLEDLDPNILKGAANELQAQLNKILEEQESTRAATKTAPPPTKQPQPAAPAAKTQPTQTAAPGAKPQAPQKPLAAQAKKPQTPFNVRDMGMHNIKP